MAAHTNASAMPVLPLVASTIVVRPGSIRPSASAASIIATPIRSLTDPPGLNISSLPKTLAAAVGHEPRELHHRRAADVLGNVDRDGAHWRPLVSAPRYAVMSRRRTIASPAARKIAT